MPLAATLINLEIIILSKVKSDHKKINIISYHLYVEFRNKKDSNELIYKTEIESQT